MTEIPEDEIAEAEQDQQSGSDHSHDQVVGADGTLSQHLVDVHGLEPAEGVSTSTQEGIHDRLHQSSKAADD